jgi:Fe-S cluster assembly protein SufB
MKYPQYAARTSGAGRGVVYRHLDGEGCYYDGGARRFIWRRLTTSLITSKSISKGLGALGLRGLVRVVPGAVERAIESRLRCAVLDRESRSRSFPYNDSARMKR